MSSIDLDSLVTALDPAGKGGRRHIDQVAAAIRDLVAHPEPAAIPQFVLDVVREGERRGCWSATTTTTVLRGSVILPKSVQLSRGKLPADSHRPVNVPLRPELARWAAALPLSRSQRAVVVAVNEWLRCTDGGKVPTAAVAERSYEILGDEKAFDSSPPRGGATLWGEDRLTFELLRCERMPTPLTWEPATATIGGAGPIVCVENHATFRTMLRALRDLETPPWKAVAWIQGRNTAPLGSLPELPFRVTRLDYLGDLDAAGLNIAAAACAAASSCGIAAGPATRLWELLLTRTPRADRRISGPAAEQLASWLPAHLRGPATLILASGRAIPQEALRYDILAAHLNDEANLMVPRAPES